MENSSVKKGFKIAIKIVVALLVAGGCFALGFITSRASLSKELGDINYIIGMYRKYYYDEKEDVVGIFADSLLDRYSAYYTPKQYEAIKQANAGSNYAIGITYDDELNLVTVAGNSPAQKAGMRKGAKIVAVKLNSETEFTEVTDKTQLANVLTDVGAGVDIDFKLLFNGETDVYTAAKAEFTETYVDYVDETGTYGFSDESGEMKYIRLYEGDTSLPADTAYIKYDWFNGNSSGLKGSVGQFARAMTAFKESGKRKIIIDLRGNGGGFLSIFSSVSAHFIDAEKGSRQPICIARNKYGSEQVFKSEAVDYSDYGFEKIVVLANAGTASASEAFIGAVLDYDVNDRVSVILETYEYGGTEYFRSYGKGIMQTTFERAGGGAIKLTTAKLFWPKSDVCIHDVGITTQLNSVYGGKIMTESYKGTAYSDAIELCR